MTKSLQNIGDAVVKDLTPFISEHTLNTICETAMGISLRRMKSFQKHYRNAVHKMGELVVYRLFRQWLRYDWVFFLTSKGREQKKILKTLHEFTEKIIAERKMYHKNMNGQFSKNLGKGTEEIDANDTEVIASKNNLINTYIALF
ncbi:hypothetical protein PUN28_001197 [Cardiocondyla obscurior]